MNSSQRSPLGDRVPANRGRLWRLAALGNEGNWIDLSLSQKELE